MLRVETEVQIGSLLFGYATSVKVSSSWQNLTQTAEITMPNNLYLKGQKITELIKVGQIVAINMGYYPNKDTVFVGYVSKLIPGTPFTVQCEDEAWRLKQKAVRNYSKDKLTLKQLIGDIYDGAFTADSAKIGSFRINGVTIAQVLDELRDKYGLYSWFRDGILNVGLPYKAKGAERHFDFQKNIIDGSGLQWTTTDDLNVISHGVSVQPKGKKIELYAYYEKLTGKILVSEKQPDGALNTYKFPNLTQSHLRDIIVRRLPQLYYKGYRGSFTTFGFPMVKHGDVAVLKDNKLPERGGRYLIKSVEISMSVNDGLRQNIEVDQVAD